MGVKTQKQLAAETLQEQHKSDLDDSCILSRQEEPTDLVMFSALYSSVNLEIGVVLWKEKGEVRINGRKRNKREETHGRKEM